MGGQHHAPAALPPGKTRYPLFVQEAGWAPAPVWTCAKDLSPTGIRSPDRPAHSQTLYRLSYPDQGVMLAACNFRLDRVILAILFGFMTSCNLVCGTIYWSKISQPHSLFFLTLEICVCVCIYIYCI
jgi:hypothetical protein